MFIYVKYFGNSVKILHLKDTSVVNTKYVYKKF